MGSAQLLKNKKTEIELLAKKHGAYDVRVFGSVARGDDTAAGDIDILVKTSPRTSSWFPAGLVQDLEDLLGRTVEVITEGALHWYIRDTILREAHPLK